MLASPAASCGGKRVAQRGNLDANSQQWTPTLEVLWSEGGDTISRRLLFKSKFSTEIDAEVRAFDFAVTWIDSGKPEIVSN